MGRILKTAASVVTGIALAVTAALGTIPADAATRCAATFTVYQPIKAGSHGAQAKAMECLLHKAGYPTTVKGRFSAADAQELAKFRKSIGLNPLLVGGRRAWSALLSRGTTPHLQAGAKGKKVLGLQLAPRSAGFSTIPITGRYGTATTDVIKVVQESHHLKRTGEVNAEFWKALQAGRIIAATVVVKKPVPPKPVSIGKKISKSQLRPGDTVFFYPGIKHVALYAGNGNVIHAPHPGKKVSYIKMKYMPYMGARRPGRP